MTLARTIIVAFQASIAATVIDFLRQAYSLRCVVYDLVAHYGASR